MNKMIKLSLVLAIGLMASSSHAGDVSRTRNRHQPAIATTDKRAARYEAPARPQQARIHNVYRRQRQLGLTKTVTERVAGKDPLIMSAEQFEAQGQRIARADTSSPAAARVAEGPVIQARTNDVEISMRIGDKTVSIVLTLERRKLVSTAASRAINKALEELLKKNAEAKDLASVTPLLDGGPQDVQLQSALGALPDQLNIAENLPEAMELTPDGYVLVVDGDRILLNSGTPTRRDGDSRRDAVAVGYEANPAGV